MSTRLLISTLVSLLLVPCAALAQSVQAFSNPIANIPGKTLAAVVVNYAPGGKTPSHHHAPSAFITAYVLEGSIRSQVDGGEIRVLHAGESFSETPGSHHTLSENASATEPAKVLAIFVVDTKDTPLTILDPR